MAGKQRREAARERKWKGKDWFAILAPDELGGVELVQTPSMDPKAVIGRNVVLPINEIMKDKLDKFYMKIRLKITTIEDHNAKTVFNGFECMREHIMRFIRKRSQKVEVIFNAKTKDGWLLRITYLGVLNRNVPETIEREFRRFVEKQISEYVKQHSVYEFVKDIVNSKIQMTIKKEGSKIYPVRFSEVEKIKVLKAAS